MNALRASPKFLSRADEGEKMRALDVGCAVGGATIELARKRIYIGKCYETFFGMTIGRVAVTNIYQMFFGTIGASVNQARRDAWRYLPVMGTG